MSQYYLLAQLPSLDAVPEHSTPPISEERFFELCRELLPKKLARDLENLTLAPKKDGEDVSSPLLSAWCKGERALRIALGSMRARKMNKPFDMQGGEIPPEIIKAASAAVESADPLEAEMLLFRYRLSFLEALRPQDTFSDDSVFYYGIKLKLLWRAARFDTERGEEAYRNIYSSILRDEQEALK